MEQTLSALADPARANAMAQQALLDAPAPTPSLPVAAPPPDTFVKLPGGAIDPNTLEFVTEAEVRELNGLDEEVLARIPPDQPGRFYAAVLRQGVVRIGTESATQTVLDNLLMGDRETLLLAIRRVTWGDEIVLHLVCPGCQSEQDAEAKLTDVVPMKELKDASDRRFTIAVPSGRKVEMHLPDGHTQSAMLALGAETNRGAINTALLTSCIDAIGDIPVLSPNPVQRLSVRDRTACLTAIGERAFGPQLGEVTVPCGACGVTIDMPLSLGTLFLF